MATQKSSARKKASVRSAKSKDLDLFALLKQDHEKVKDLFEEITDGENGESAELFSEIQSELMVHMDGEEKFFYPALEEADEDEEKVLEAYEEHHVAKNVLGEFRGMEPDGARWKAKVKVLQELVEHHIQEEEKEVFKQAKKVLDKEQLREIAEQIEERKRQTL